jgi:hypothetical protein
MNLNALVGNSIVTQAPARKGLRALPTLDASVVGMVGLVTPVTAVVASRNV